jgi:hypothetical protein
VQFIGAPLHIVSESYGGKMAAGFARAIIDAQAREDLKVNFRYHRSLHACLACKHPELAKKAESSLQYPRRIAFLKVRYIPIKISVCK